MIKKHNLEQGTEEWFQLRKGKLTASNATPIGANGSGLRTYCKKVVTEALGIERVSYTNLDMERGNELEPIARMAYEIERGVDVEEVGFITSDEFDNVGASPDGLVGEDGGIEIKARNDEKHLSLILGEDKEIPKAQIQMTLLITGRAWWDFVSFNPNFTKPLFIKRIYPDLIYHEKLKLGFESGRKLIAEYLNEYKNYKL